MRATPFPKTASLPQTGAVHPHLVLAYSIMALLISFFTWAVLGNLDILVTASGRLAPIAPNPILQAPASSQPLVLKTIHVQNYQQVLKGDLLLSFDTTALLAEQASLLNQIKLSQSDTTRLQFQSRMSTLAPATPQSKLQLNADTSALSAQLKEAQAAVQSTASQLDTSRSEEQRLRTLLAATTLKQTQQQTLVAEGFLPKSTLQDTQADTLNLQGQLSSQEKRTTTLQLELTKAQASAARIPLEANKTNTTQLFQNNYSLSSLQTQLARVSTALAQADIRAPASGTVQGLTLSSPSQVVPSATPLLQITPTVSKLSELQAEAWVHPEDAQYLQTGTPARIKLAAFPFQKHGWLQGSIVSIASSTQLSDNPLPTPQTYSTNPANQPVYRVLLSIDPTQPYWHPQPLAMTTASDLSGRSPAIGTSLLPKPGSTLQVDFQLGTRTPFQYLSQNLTKITHTALTER